MGLAAGVGSNERATTYKALRLTLPCGGFKCGRRVPVPAHLLGRCQRLQRITARATRGAAAATYVTGVSAFKAKYGKVQLLHRLQQVQSTVPFWPNRLLNTW